MIVYPFELPYGRTDARLYYRPVRGHQPLLGDPEATLTVLNPFGVMVVNTALMIWNESERRFEAELDLSDTALWPKASGYQAQLEVVTEERGFTRSFSFSVCAEVWEPNLTFDDLAALSSESAFVRQADAAIWPRLLTEAAQDVYLRLRERSDRPALVLGMIRDELDRAHKWKTLELFYLR